MTTWAILATGASNSPAAIRRLRHLPCIAVNNAYHDAPWARALVANDAAWWREHPAALDFAGEKWCGNKFVRGTFWLPPSEWTGTHSNSGLRALDLAINRYLAKRILLLGVDLAGGHYHADHPAPLKNPDSIRFALFRAQFTAYQVPAGVEVINCSPISTLECFPVANLDDVLDVPIEVATC